MQTTTTTIDQLESDQPSQRDLLIQRLTEVNLPTEQFVDLQGKGSSVNHTLKENQHPLTQIEGNYGVMPHEDLVVVDIDHDDYAHLPNELRGLIHSEDTLTVRSPHFGLHLYFRCDGDIDNSKPWWGEIRANNWFVVGPGSTIDHDECSGCQYEGTGHYYIEIDKSIRTIDTETLDALRETDDPDVETVDPSEVESTFEGVRNNRLAHAQRRDRKLRHLFLWACGKRGLSGMPYSDRSRAECALTQKLLWWFEHDVDTVREILDEIQPPKWAYRGERYRQSVIQAGLNYTAGKGKKYDPNYSSDRSGVSLDAGMRVILAIDLITEQREEPKVRTKEIVEHPFKTPKRNQVLEVLNQLEAEGYVEYEREGRCGYWIIHDLPEASDPGFFEDYLSDDQLAWQRAKHINGIEF